MARDCSSYYDRVTGRRRFAFLPRIFLIAIVFMIDKIRMKKFLLLDNLNKFIPT